MKTTHIIISKSVCMPNSCWGNYGKIAVIRVFIKNGVPAKPKMISNRARGVDKIIQIWDRLNIGSTDRCAFNRAMVEANALIEELNQ